MKILAIDTSGQEAGAAIIVTQLNHLSSENSPYIPVGEVFLNARTGAKSYTHSEILMPAVEQLFGLTRLAPAEIDFVAYTCGPGSFTGLRIGASCALGLARAANVPAIAVPTLDALAYNILGTGGGAVIVPMLDARRGQVYSAVFQRDELGAIRRVSDYFALPLTEILAKLREYPGAKIFLGDGADFSAIREVFPEAVFPSAGNCRNRAVSAAVWAAEKISAGENFPAVPELLYIRQPQAVREAAK